jgi:hypothetical protein
MKRNVAGQVIGAQMTDATNGNNFTAAVVCSVTGDGGTQALGSVGAGVCTHEGLGFHTYTPAQAETDYNHIGFTFTGAGAITATLQVYTADPASQADVEFEIESYGALKPTVPGRTLDVTATGAAGIDWGNVENQATVVNLSNTTIASAFALDPVAMAAIADAILTRDWTLIPMTADRSLLNAARFLRNKWFVSAGFLTVTEEDDATVAWVGVTTGTPGADPITAVDPT